MKPISVKGRQTPPPQERGFLVCYILFWGHLNFQWCRQNEEEIGIKHEETLKHKDDLKIEDAFKNEDDHKNKDNCKAERNSKMKASSKIKTTLKMKMTSKWMMTSELKTISKLKTCSEKMKTTSKMKTTLKMKTQKLFCPPYPQKVTWIYFWWLHTLTAKQELMSNRICYQVSKPEMEFHMIDVIYGVLPMRAQTEKMTFSWKDG